jgi:hypothetical protein
LGFGKLKSNRIKALTFNHVNKDILLELMAAFILKLDRENQTEEQKLYLLRRIVQEEELNLTRLGIFEK